MSESNGPTINVGGITGAGNINNIGTNNIDGGQSVTNNNASQPPELAAVETVCKTLAEDVFVALDVPTDASTEEVKIPIETELHPLTLFAQAKEYAANPDAVTADEEESFGSRWREMLRRGGEKAAVALTTVGPIAVSVIKAMASPPFPWNLVAAGLETAVSVVKSKSE
jgi:hypothetical protein